MKTKRVYKFIGCFNYYTLQLVKVPKSGNKLKRIKAKQTIPKRILPKRTPYRLPKGLLHGLPKGVSCGLCDNCGGTVRNGNKVCCDCKCMDFNFCWYCGGSVDPLFKECYSCNVKK